MMSIIDFCKNVNFEVNLLDLMMVLFSSVLITVIFLVVKKVVLTLKTQRKIDQRLRKTRTRISRVVAEIEEYDRIKVEVEVQRKPNAIEEERKDEVPCIKESYEVAPKRKKTRAMSMEERWAEYDQKRLMRSTA